MKAKLVVKTKELLSLLSAISMAATFDLSNPKFSTLNIALSKESDGFEIKLSLASSNMSARAYMPVEFTGDEGLESFSADVALKLFMSAVKPVTSDEIEIYHELNRLTVKSGRFQVSCPISQDVGQPFWPESETSITLDYGTVKGLLSGINWAVGKKSANDAFSSAHLVNENGLLVGIASDVASLARLESKHCTLPTEWPKDLAIDAKLNAAISRLPFSDNESLTVSVNSVSNPGVLTLCGTDFELSGALVQAKFPDYTKMLSIPEDARGVSVVREELLDTISRLNSVMTSDGAKWIRARLDFAGGECVVTPTTISFAASDVFPYSNENFDLDEEFSVKLDTGKLESALRNSSSEIVILAIPRVANLPVHLADYSSNEFHFVTSRIV